MVWTLGIIFKESLGGKKWCWGGWTPFRKVMEEYRKPGFFSWLFLSHPNLRLKAMPRFNETNVKRARTSLERPYTHCVPGNRNFLGTGRWLSHICKLRHTEIANGLWCWAADWEIRTRICSLGKQSHAGGRVFYSWMYFLQASHYQPARAGSSEATCHPTALYWTCTSGEISGSEMAT